MVTISVVWKLPHLKTQKRILTPLLVVVVVVVIVVVVVVVVVVVAVVVRNV